MMGAGHRAVGSAAGLTLAALTHQPPWAWPLTIGLAIATSHGHTSPDIDQTRWWRALDRWLPDEALGEGGPLQHRGLTHWWAIPTALAITTHLLAPHAIAWVAYAAITGWASHLIGDLVFGRPGCGRGPGIPLLGWHTHVGVGLKVGGWTETAVTAVIVPATVAALVWVAAGTPSPV